MVSNILGRRHSTSELSLLRSPASQISTFAVDERHIKKAAAVASPKTKVTDNGKIHQNFNMKERLLNLRSRPSLPQQQQQQQQQQQHTLSKRVMFAKDEAQRVATWSRSDFSWEECCSYWVQPEETEESIERNWIIIDAHEKSKKNKDSTFQMCTRGLEAYILERQRGKKIHSTKQKNAHMAVLQWGRGLSDEERARRYQLVSKRCVKRALEYARRDAITARRILTEDSGLPMASHSQRSQRSCSSTISTQSDLDLPCAPKKRHDAWTRNSDKEGVLKTGKKKKKKEAKLRPCLKQATGAIPEIMPEIYVRTRMVLVSDQRKGRSKTRLSSTNRTGEREGNRRTTPQRANSTSSTLQRPRQLQKHKRSSSLPKVRQELPLEKVNREPTQENRDANSSPKVLAHRPLDDDTKHSREVVISRLIQGASPRCPRPAHLECNDGLIDETSVSNCTTMTSVVRANVRSRASF